MIEDIKARKNKGEPLVCLTAYTAPMAATLAPHVDLLLVGDSLGMALYGMSSTRDVTLDIMINHGQAVMRRHGEACVIIDLPFGSYEDSAEKALRNARRVVDETGCHGVKLEGGEEIAPTIRRLIDDGISVMAHIGLTPQSVNDGKFRIQGKTTEQAMQLKIDALAVQNAGAFAVVIEGTIEPVAAELSAILDIPTIGIGASVKCDGQILVTEDMLGLLDGHTPKFVRQYADLKMDIAEAARHYAADVRSRTFPSEAQTYTVPNSKKSKAS